MDFLCKSPETILQSLSDWFDCPISETISILKEDWATKFNTALKDKDDSLYKYDFDEEDERIYEDFGIYVLYKGFADYTIINKEVNIHWFHGSRVVDVETFRNNGIIPLQNIFPTIKTLIDDIAKQLNISECNLDSSWKDQKKELLQLKMNNDVDKGPCAMLMYEAVVNADAFSCHSYIDEPEIISDYSIGKYGEDGNLIISEFKRITKPVVVEFIEQINGSDKTKMDYIVSTALTYMYRYIHNEDLDWQCNTCFSGYGKFIPPERIIDIIVL